MMSKKSKVKAPFWNTIWTNLFAQNPKRKTKMSPTQPTWALKSQTKAPKKTPKNHVIFSVFRPRDLPRDPQETQQPPKKHPKRSKGPKKGNQKKTKSASVVKNALRWRSHLGPWMATSFGATFCSLFSSSFYICVLPLFKRCWNSFWNQVWDQSGPRWPRWSQKKQQDLQRTKNLHFQKP